MSAGVDPDDLTGHRLEHYEIRRKLGKGGICLAAIAPMVLAMAFMMSDARMPRDTALRETSA